MKFWLAWIEVDQPDTVIDRHKAVVEGGSRRALTKATAKMRTQGTPTSDH